LSEIDKCNRENQDRAPANQELFDISIEHGQPPAEMTAYPTLTVGLSQWSPREEAVNWVRGRGQPHVGDGKQK
jgi:hypothetical protein